MIIRKYMQSQRSGIIVIKHVLDHLSVLKAVDGSGFVSNTKHSNIILHPFYNFQLNPYNTNQLISNNIYKGNRLLSVFIPW